MNGFDDDDKPDAFRDIDPTFLGDPPAKADPTPRSRLEWLPIADLVVDARYQRPIGARGAANIRKIAAAFSWAKFAPVIVAPLEDGTYAIIDGQHRATAARWIGHEKVPACIVEADHRAQAEAFASVNGVVTAVNAPILLRAKIAAGDPEAVALADLCARSGVVISPYPKSADLLAPNETMALGSIRRAMRAYSRETVATALRCIAESEQHGNALKGQIILAVCAVLERHKVWREAGGALLEAFDRIDLLAIGVKNTQGRAPARLIDDIAAALTRQLALILGPPVEQGRAAA